MADPKADSKTDKPKKKCRFCPMPGGRHHHGCCMRSSKKKLPCVCVMCTTKKKSFAKGETLREIALTGIPMTKLLYTLCSYYGLTRQAAVRALSRSLYDGDVEIRDDWMVFSCQ